MSMSRPAPASVRLMLLALLLVLWEVVPMTGLLPELFLPALSKTLGVLYSDRHIYAAALLVTLYEVACSMLIACGLGILAGALVGGTALLRDLLLPVFSSLYAVPIVILYPIFTAWFGVGSSSKIAFAGVYGFFPVMLSTAAGIRTTGHTSSTGLSPGLFEPMCGGIFRPGRPVRLHGPGGWPARRRGGNRSRWAGAGPAGCRACSS